MCEVYYQSSSELVYIIHLFVFEHFDCTRGMLEETLCVNGKAPPVAPGSEVSGPGA